MCCTYIKTITREDMNGSTARLYKRLEPALLFSGNTLSCFWSIGCNRRHSGLHGYCRCRLFFGQYRGIRHHRDNCHSGSRNHHSNITSRSYNRIWPDKAMVLGAHTNDYNRHLKPTRLSLRHDPGNLHALAVPE